ncbi:hypothetical protein pEaSNUABM11_00021 [Erwinia phage pEa_SNUABM_11]|nr:hypothetical protein pEaSNUABM11_00021 [Erwinia phage pEa_SNUABM_11]
MTNVLFELYPGLGSCIPTDIIKGIQELLFPGMYPDIPKRILTEAERQFGSSAWYTVFSLGRHHAQPFHFCNGVVTTWSNYTSNQLMSIIRSGNQSCYPLTEDVWK